MKYVKILGFLAVAAAALLAFAGTASATTTEAPGDPIDAGDYIHLSSTNSELDAEFGASVKCGGSTITAEATSAGGTSSTVKEWTFSECGKDTYSILSNGTLSIASNGMVTSNNMELTTLLHRTVFGAAVTTHCIYKTENTSIGSLTEGETPELHIGSSSIPNRATDSGCSNATLTGDYAVTSPSYLAVDTASATTTEAPGDPIDAGDPIHLESTNVELDAEFGAPIKCGGATITAEVTAAGGTSSTVEEWTFSSCSSDTYIVLSRGMLSITSSGEVRSTGMELTTLLHRTVFGVPVTTHCIYATNNTKIGTLKEGTEPELNIGSSAIPNVATDSGCSNATWTGNYNVTSPHYLTVD